MNIQNNIKLEDQIIDENHTYRYEVIPTKNFLHFFSDPEERQFAIDAIIDSLINQNMIAIDEDYLLMIEGIIPFYTGEAVLNGNKFIVYIYLNTEENYQFLVFDKPKKGDNFKFFHINHEENISISKILH